jgi:hypothetical protein
LTITPLPSYSPDYNPIAYLWRATKREATHNHYFPEFADLVASVQKTLTTLATHPDYVQSLFTFYLEQMQQAQPFQFPPLPWLPDLIVFLKDYSRLSRLHREGGSAVRE